VATGPTELPDLGELALTPEQVAELAPLQKVSQPRQARSARAKFVKLPYEQTLLAAGELQNAQLAVLVELSHLMFKMHQNPVPLSNTALRSAGMSRMAKLRALRQLEAVGLVKVTRRGQKSPLVTALWE
jgi:hypothetical protein